MKGTNLGEFEELILLMAGRLYPEAYGVGIKENIIEITGRSVTLSAVHSALIRLEKKGFLKSEFGEATPERGGKRKKFFFITPYGSKALEETRELREQLWKQITPAALGNND